MTRMLTLALVAASFGFPAMAADNRIDEIRPDAPELAAFGTESVGVRTIEIVHKDQPDIAHAEAGKPIPLYDRKLKLEIWYPAVLPASGSTDYPGVFLRDGKTKVTLHGRAHRDEVTSPAEPAYPLVILSHGYPGNRFLLSHFGENLASKGYVVAAIDHPDSTYDDLGAFGSTLVNRPQDQIFALNEIARLSQDSGSFLNELVDTDHTAVIGYSMGGYGAVITAGAGVAPGIKEADWGVPEGALAVNRAGSAELLKRNDDRIKAVVAIAPWGMQKGFWDEDGLAKIRKPLMVIGGSVDDVADYSNGIARIYDGAVNTDRYLLTFKDANHNAAAPIPAPVESWQRVPSLDFVPFDHYADPVWDTVRMNNIAGHFVTAFLGRYLREDEAMGTYLDLVENASDGVYAANPDGSLKPGHTYWKGFQDRTAVGLSLKRSLAGSN